MRLLLLSLFLPLFCYSQKLIVNGNRFVTSSLSFISETETVWNSTTTPKTTATIAANNLDILVAFEIIADNAATGSISDNGNAGTLTWTQKQVINVGSNCWVSVWTASATATTTTGLTVSFARTASAQFCGGGVYVFRNSAGGIGNTAQNHATGQPSVSLTTASNNSMVVCVSADWAAVNSSRTWRTVNSITPSSGNGFEKTFFNQASQYTVYSSYYNNTGTAGANTYGLSAPTGQTYQTIAVEIKP